MTVRIMVGDALTRLCDLPAASVYCCVTSPPYYGLRDYGVNGQIGLEETPDAYVAKLVDVFREVRRVLRDDGTLWLNIGDSYASGTKGTGGGWAADPNNYANKAQAYGARQFNTGGLADKQLMGVPWRVAFALQADGWYLRQDIIWHKPNPMPESVRDRCTKAHEYLFLLSKSARYYFDAAAIAEQSEGRELFGNKRSKGRCEQRRDNERRDMTPTEKRNKRSVWTIATRPYRGAHFATFPPKLVEPCIKAGCPEGGTVLDPFGGAGTTGLVAKELGRSAILIELNRSYAELARKRIGDALIDDPEAEALLA